MDADPRRSKLICDMFYLVRGVNVFLCVYLCSLWLTLIEVRNGTVQIGG